MRHKNYGVDTLLPPLHSSETAPDSSINQIMELSIAEMNSIRRFKCSEL